MRYGMRPMKFWMYNFVSCLEKNEKNVKRQRKEEVRKEK
jgi:hypothetical protein